MDMTVKKEDRLTDEELEILQEIMNIAFGQSAADLTEVIDTQVVLSVPYINAMQIIDIPGYIKEHVQAYEEISIVEQKFWGRFKGDAILVFSSGSGRELISLLQQERNVDYESDPVEVLERETLMEVGNILIGACVGKISELLKDVVAYTPPVVMIEKEFSRAVKRGYYDDGKTAIVLKTDFSFHEGNVSGFLFLVTSNESIRWMKKALKSFLEQYE